MPFPYDGDRFQVFQTLACIDNGRALINAYPIRENSTKIIAATALSALFLTAQIAGVITIILFFRQNMPIDAFVADKNTTFLFEPIRYLLRAKSLQIDVLIRVQVDP